MDKIGMIATYPARRNCLHEMLLTVFHNIDQIYIYCNQYKTDEILQLSHWISHHKGSCEVMLIDPSATNGDIKDMGKFWAMDFLKGYVFLLDDDLRYPDDYVDKHIQAINSHQSISTIHGRVINNHPLDNYFIDTTSINYKNELVKYQRVNIAGTGTVAFHTDHIKGKLFATDDDMNFFKGMADIWFACQALYHEINIYCLPRPKNWLVDTGNSGGVSLYDQYKEDTSRQVGVLNEYNWPVITLS